MANAVLLQIHLTSNVKSLFLDQFPLLSGYVLLSFCLRKANVTPCGGGWMGKASICIFAYCHLSASGLGAMTSFPWQLNVSGATISS